MAIAFPGTAASSYVFPMLVTVVVSLVLVVECYRKRAERVAVPLGILVAALGIWALADVMRLSIPDPATMAFWYRVRMSIESVIGLLLFLFVAHYVEWDRWRSRPMMAVLFLTPLFINVLLWTPLSVGEATVFTVVDTTTYTDPVFGTQHLELVIEQGLLYSYVVSPYTDILMIGSLVLLFYTSPAAEFLGAYRGHRWTILGAVLVPWATNLAFLFELTTVDLTAAAYSVTIVLLAMAIFQYDIIELVPIARDTAVENMSEGFAVLDREGRIVDVNPAAETFLGVPADRVIDRHVEDVYEDFPALVDTTDERPGTEVDQQVEVMIDGQPRHFHVKVSPITDSTGGFVGRVVLFQDVTPQVRRKEALEAQTVKLEHQNEHLEQFASIVSHDLRNPLSVIDGYLPMARETGADEDFEMIERNVDRMKRLIDEILTMTQQGQPVLESESIAIADLATDAWDHVDTRSADLRIETDRTVEGDPNRLLQVFENLFRNAIEHGGDDVTVTTGNHPNGFFVEDDGPGIPADELDEVFEHGYSTNPDGTGFGLSIVKMAIQAHGWQIEVGESDLGGARFTVTGVDGSNDIDPWAGTVAIEQ